MLSNADARLARQDCALPGLGLLLDADALRAELEVALGGQGFESFEVDYVRYKPARNCLVRFQGALQPGGPMLIGYAKAYRADAADKVNKAGIRDTSDSPIGDGRFVLPSRAVEICLLPNDNKLEQLPQLIGTGNPCRVLNRLQPDDADWSQGKLTALNYKPERRYVARLDIPDSSPVLIRLYGPDEYQPTSIATPEHEREEFRIPRLLGRSDSKRAIAVSWLEGRPLNGFFPADPGLESALEAAGTALAAFHAIRAPTGRRGHSAEIQIRRLRSNADMLGALLPATARRVRQLARALGAELLIDQPEEKLIHGDLHSRQIIVRGDRIGLIDLDECRRGDPCYDLGLLLAHFDRDALAMNWEPDLPNQWAEALLHGYEYLAPPLDRRRLATQRAAGLFQLLVHHFRNRSPDWPEQTLAGLARVEALLVAAQRPRALLAVR